MLFTRDDWHADLRSTQSKLAQAEHLVRAKESEVEDLRKAYEVFLDHHHQIQLLTSQSSQAFSQHRPATGKMQHHPQSNGTCVTLCCCSCEV